MRKFALIALDISRHQEMAAILLSAGTTVAFWDEQTLSKNSLYQKCTPPDVLDCSSYWKSVVLSGSSKWGARKDIYNLKRISTYYSYK